MKPRQAGSLAVSIKSSWTGERKWGGIWIAIAPDGLTWLRSRGIRPAWSGTQWRTAFEKIRSRGTAVDQVATLPSTHVQSGCAREAAVIISFELSNPTTRADGQR